MTRRLPVAPSPGPLEEYVVRFDDLFRARAQRDGFRRYLEGLLLPAERNKTLTALANTEPLVGAQRKEAQSLQWFLSESGWDPRKIQERRLELLLEDPSTAPDEDGVLVIDEHGDRKWGKHTADVGRQWLANIGKTENGVVSVSSLWADEGVYWPVDLEPYTPSHHFGGGKNDAAFRTKLKIASGLVAKAVERGLPFRAVVADSFYGEDRGFKRSLLGNWASPTCFRSRSRTRGGTLRERSAPCGKRLLRPDGKALGSPADGRRWCARFATGTGRIGGLWRWRPAPTAESGPRGRSWSPQTPQGCPISPPGT